jgi:hypothetical protein
MKTIISKSKAGHYHLTVRDSRGMIVFKDKYSCLEDARRIADDYRLPSEKDYFSALQPCGK